MKRILALIVAMVMLLMPIWVLAQEDGEQENLLYNADFSIFSDQAFLPAGWSLYTYGDASNAFVLDEDGLLEMAVFCNEADDARVCQDVRVEPDTVYCLSAMVRAESILGGQGATLSIDNFSVDGTYCYSAAISDTETACPLQLYFKTGPEQELVRVALRVGGYGAETSGIAYFSDISLSRQEAPSGTKVIDLASSVGYTASSTAGSKVVASTGSSAFIAMIVSAMVTLLVGVALYYYVVLREGDGLACPVNNKGALWCILAGAFILRVILSVIFYGHKYDINCFMAWGNAVASGGTANFYTSGMFADYPPGYMYVCGMLASIARLFNMTYGSSGFALLFKMPGTICDVLMAYLVYHISGRQGMKEPYRLFLTAVVAFNPATAFVSGAWGQVESILMLLVVLAIYLLQEGLPIAGGIVYALAVLLKPQALMFGPILAVGYFTEVVHSTQWKKQLIKTVVAVAAAFLLLFLASIPFKGTQEFGWMIKKYFNTSTSYPYATVEAFNFPALLGDNWAPVTTRVLGLPYTVWGPLFIVLGIFMGAILYVRARLRFGWEQTKGALYLSAASMMMVIYTFGYYMHERYLMPVLLLLAVAYLYDKDSRIFVSLSITTAAVLVNVLAAMYIVDHQELRGSMYDRVVFIGSFLTLVACLYTCYVSISILWMNHHASPVPVQVRSHASSVTTKGCAKKHEPLLPVSDGTTERSFTRRDVYAVTILTAVYAVCAVFNLGSLSAPQTVWTSSDIGESVMLSFPGEYDVGAYWVNGNIRDGGELLLSSEDGYEEIYTQHYDEMFRWDAVETSFHSSKVQLTVYSGSLCLNEIAFFDVTGARIPVSIIDPQGTQEALVDEQLTVPEHPSYYNGMYFDELYHARTAYEHLHNLAPYENSHPPLGKLLIAIGIAVFGMNPFGWRIVGTMFGIGMVPILYAFGKRMFKRMDYALLLSALFAFDFMHFTQTRIATIDVYGVFFILLMYYFMYRYITMNLFVDGLKNTLKPLAWCGLFFGLGCASKWICIYAGGGLALLFFGSLIARWGEYKTVLQQEMAPGGYTGGTAFALRIMGLPARYQSTASERRQVREYWKLALYTCLWCCLFFIVVPLVIYFASYTPYYLYEASQSSSGYSLFDALSTCRRYQEYMWTYHSGLNATHPFQSTWYEWPFTNRPMWYYSGTDYVRGIVSTMSASGNPAVWWVSTIGALVLLALRSAGMVKKDRVMQVFCIGVLANYLPWVLVPRCTFIYHFFATVPFILMATVYLCMKAEERWQRIWFVKWIWLGLAIVLFILLYPGLSGYPVSMKWASFIKTLPGGGLMYGA